jgi:filamentous hemagglutinin family protein
MKTKLYLSFLTLTTLILSVSHVQAQTYQPSNRTPVSDSTLGTQVSGNGGNFNITGGVSKGQTLFHSFTDFSVPTNGQANFLNPVGNRDIITRVTGNLFSDLNGAVNTNGANFFLINPNGIVFGPNAQLNVGKAFVGSTANSLDLVDGSGRTITFGTNPNGDAPLLAVNPNVMFNVSALNFGGGAGQISNFGGLAVNQNQYIGLIGGNVTMNGGTLIDTGGRVELGGLSAPGTVTLGVEGNNIRAQFPSNVARGDVTLNNFGMGVGIGTGIGDIAISGRNVDLGKSFLIGGDLSLDAAGAISFRDGSQLLASTFIGGNAGNITVTAKEGVSLVGSEINSQVEPGILGNGGNIKISAGLLSLQDSGIRASTFGQGNAGNITVKVPGAVSLAGQNKFTGILSTVEAGGVGNGGNIDVTAGSLSLRDGAPLGAVTRAASDTQPAAQGNAGNVTVKVAGAIDIAGTKVSSSAVSGLFSYIGEGATGNGGNINVDAGSLSLRDGANLTASTFGQGNAGNVKVIAKEAVSLVDAGVYSEVAAGSVGNGGNIDIAASSLSLQDGGQIEASTSGQGNAGNITVKVSGNVSLSGSKLARLFSLTGINPELGNLILNIPDINDGYSSWILSTVEAGAIGNGGNINLTAGSLSLQDGAPLGTVTRAASGTKPAGEGNAGNITVKVTGAIYIADKQNGSSKVSGMYSYVDPGTKGNGGNININTGSLSLRDGAAMQAGNFSSQGVAGDISITSDRIDLRNSSISSYGKDVSGGNINLKTTDRLLLIRSGICTNCGGIKANSDGGNITIKSPLIIATPVDGTSEINANTFGGKGGNVFITSQGLFGIKYRQKGQDLGSYNFITASSEFGQQGTVKIDTPGTDPGKDSTELPKVTTDASNQISQVCSATNRQNKLTVTGRGGLPPTANDPLTSDVIWQDARAASSQPVASSATTNPVKLAPPAVGWIFDGKGKVTLVAAKTAEQPTGTSVVCPNIK